MIQQILLFDEGWTYQDPGLESVGALLSKIGSPPQMRRGLLGRGPSRDGCGISPKRDQMLGLGASRAPSELFVDFHPGRHKRPSLRGLVSSGRLGRTVYGFFLRLE